MVQENNAATKIVCGLLLGLTLPPDVPPSFFLWPLNFQEVDFKHLFTSNSTIPYAFLKIIFK